MASAARKFLPILGWLPAYRREWMLADVLAGVAHINPATDRMRSTDAQIWIRHFRDAADHGASGRRCEETVQSGSAKA
jgi:hypothetical protein